VNPSAWANCGGSIAGDETYAYDAIGNLTNKDGVGYAYPASGAGSVRLHAVSSTTACPERSEGTAAVQTRADDGRPPTADDRGRDHRRFTRRR
jgi:hypothetical protein